MKKVQSTRIFLALCAVLGVLAVFGCPTAGDVTAPVVSGVFPGNTNTGIAIDTTVVATFNEELDAATIIAANFTLASGSNAMAGVVSYDLGMATFTPDADLAYSTEYTATVTTGVTDLSGNALAVNKVWTFTTVAAPDTTPPSAVIKFPANGATGVSLDCRPSATFNEKMNPATIVAANFTLMKAATPVSGSVTYEVADWKGVFAPDPVLEASTTYTATITTSVTDASGNALAANEVWSFTTEAANVLGLLPVRLGTAGNFVVLAKTAITDVPPCDITGNVGLSPAAESYITGFSQTKATGYSLSPQVHGAIYAADMTPPTPSNMTIAIGDMEAAYTDAAGRPAGVGPNLNAGGGTIGGWTFTPGVWTWGTDVEMDDSITINGGANDVFIFQIAGKLNVASGKIVTLTGGAVARNVFWQLSGIAKLGTGSQFQGIILSQTQVQMDTGASLLGRALAQTQVTLDTNAITEPAQ